MGSLVKEIDVDSISQCWGEICESHMKKASINIFGISLFFKVMGVPTCSTGSLKFKVTSLLFGLEAKCLVLDYLLSNAYENLAHQLFGEMGLAIY